jgi:tetratricopeptide (TPR) repeat protein
MSRIDGLIGATYGDQGHFREGIAAYLRALQATVEPRERVNLRLRLADMYTMVGDSQALGILNETIADLDPQTQPLELASARVQLARHWHYASRFSLALELLDQARPVLEERGDPFILTRTQAHYAGAYQHLGRFEDSDRWAERLIRLGESSGYTFAVAAGHEYLAENANARGVFERGAEHALLDRQLGERIGSLDRIAWSRFSSAWAQAGLGELELAEETVREGLDLAERIGDERLVVLATSTLVTTLASRGTFDEAHALVESTLGRADSLGQVFIQSFALSAAGYLELRRGDALAALRYLEDARRIYQPTESLSSRLLAGGLLAEGELAAGSPEPAERDALDHLELAQRAGAPREQVRALRTLAGLAMAGGDLPAAERSVEQAIALHADRADPIELGRTLVLRSLIDLRHSDPDAARRNLTEAEGIFERIGAVPDLEQARRLPS